MQNSKTHHPTLTTPLSGTTCHQQTSINLQAKFEVSNYTHYEDMKSSEKCRNWDSLGVRGSLKVISNVTVRQSAYDFLFDFYRNCASTLYRFRDIASYLWKVADFNPPQLHYRKIALVSHASKILLRIIQERIRVKTETEIADEQAGFRQGRRTRDQM